MSPRRRKRREPRRIEIGLSTSALLRVLLVVVLLVVAIDLRVALLLFLIAVLGAVTLEPTVKRLQSRGLSRGGAVVLLAATIVAAISGFAVFIMPPFAQELANLVANFDTIRRRIDGELPADSPVLGAIARKLLELPDSPEVREWVARPLMWGRVVAGIVGGGVIVIVLTFYLLLDGKRLYAWLLSYVPRRHRQRMAETVGGVRDVVHSYVRGQVVTSALCGTFTFVLLTVLGVPAALPLAITAAMLDVVPILGIVAMTALAGLLALTVSGLTALVVVAAFVLYHVFEVYVLVPRVYGRSLRLSTLAVILALLVGGLLQGVLGALLVLPLVAAYPIVERIWLRRYLGTDVVTDHAALAESAGTEQERDVQKKVIRGEPHEPPPAATSSVAEPREPAGGPASPTARRAAMR